MIIQQISINFLLFIIGIFGIFLNYRNILVLLMGVEIILLSSTLNFIFFSIYLNDTSGLIFALFILSIAASESALGLALVINYYKSKGFLYLDKESLFRN